MKTDTYRVSERHTEIIKVLQTSKNGRENYLWRTNKRQLMPLSIDRIHEDLNLIEASCFLSGTNTVAVGDELFLKLHFRDSSFKTRVIAVNGINLKLQLPEEIVLAEKRREPRQYFNPSEGKVLEMRTTSGSVETLSVSDISSQGVALILNSKQADSIKLKDRITVEALGNSKIFPSIIGEVVFKNPHPSGSKIGIRMTSQFPKLIFDDFIIREKFYSITDEKVVPTEALRKKVHERMELVLGALKTRKNLKDVFLNINFSDSKRMVEQQYQLQHIRLLSEVMCGLGTRLGWVTDTVAMDKMIYVAFMHDAPFFESIKLSRIQSLKHFERVKNRMSAEEQTMFLQGPTAAASLADEDLESYPDATKILVQQKELPDGTGFPYGIGASNLTALSCLFILSHYFVDYVLDCHDWSLADFTKTYEGKLTGQHFEKIFQVLK